MFHWYFSYMYVAKFCSSMWYTSFMILLQLWDGTAISQRGIAKTEGVPGKWIKSWNKLWHYNSLHNCWFCSLRAQNNEWQSRGESWMLSGRMSGEAAKRHMKCMRMSSKKKTTFLSHSPEGLAIGTWKLKLIWQ